MIYFYPNRPILVPPDPKNPLEPKPNYINQLEKTGKYIAEQKWNGDNALIYTGESPANPVIYNRHKEKLKRYTPDDETKEELSLWPKNSILNAEIVHNRTKNIKNLIIVHCIMAWKGTYLTGKTWGQSRKILEEMIKNGLSGIHVQISKTWKKGFWNLFQQTDGNIIEGIILKNPSGKLVFSTTPIKDVPWMLKIRKPCAKYNF